ncbi:MAG: flavin reductase family protein [Usitatibacter sp.]
MAVASLRAAARVKKAFPLSKVYGLLETGPVVMVTTSRKGRPNVMTQSWHTMIEFEPPTVGCVIAAPSLTFETLKATKECVINIPTREIAEKAVKCGNATGRSVDKFKAFGLTAVPASRVAAPLIAECYASLECRLADARMAGKYNFFVLEVVAAWVDASEKDPRTLHHRGNGLFMVAGPSIKLRSRMK